ncbi:LLM class flavin-dependent oxidoreductase [Streptomyces sp. SID8352]|uniref:LLM class flavin-dependent oxidoreductase n=1 Tax=Streptomyces sp. SID8352 TaxID=2690338 RepID=UPI001371FBEB|nr:LLM class flavin-dependent oxidoreductase [Streptomyces sp. SID8352]
MTENDGPRIGVVLPGREAVVTGGGYPRRIAALAARAEGMGYDSVWAGESPLARCRFDPLLLLAAAAARTERIALGTAVVLGVQHQPVRLAHATACLDQLAGGRLLLGLGVGFTSAACEAEFAALGVPYQGRVQRSVELIEACRLLWQSHGEPVNYEGTHVRLRDVAMEVAPHTKGGPPLWLAGAAAPALRRVGSLADGWFPTATGAQSYAEGWRAVESSRSRAGRPEGSVTPAMYVTVALGKDRPAAEADLERFVRGYYRQDLASIRRTQGVFGGTPEQVAGQLLRYADAGARHFALRLATPDLLPSSYERALTDVAQRLVPLLRRRTPAPEPGGAQPCPHR